MALRSVEILVAEHRAVESALGQLEGLIDDFLTNSEVPDAAKQALGNISDLLSRDLALHIQKEDSGLFPALEKFLPREQGPLAVMLHEHREITQENQALREGVADLDQHPSTAGRAAAQIRDHGRWLVQELRSHLFKEEHILFPFAEARLSEEEDREIVEKFQAIASSPAPYRQSPV
jgi:regulator of cell morphogenesis and NO signaling